MDNEAKQKAAVATRETEKLGAQVATIKIRKEADLKAATELLAQIRQVGKNIRSTKDSIIKPLLLSIKNTRDLFRDPESRVKAAEDTIKAEIVVYHDRVAKRAEKQAAKIEEAVDAGDSTLQEGMQKLSKVKQAENAVRTDSGSAQIRVTKKLKITDPGKLIGQNPGLLLRDRVLEALRIEVADDVLRKKQPCPEGAEVYEEKGVAVSNG